MLKIKIVVLFSFAALGARNPFEFQCEQSLSKNIAPKAAVPIIEPKKQTSSWQIVSNKEGTMIIENNDGQIRTVNSAIP